MNGEKFLIDTDIIIDYLNQRYNLSDKFLDVGLENCYVSEVTISELYFGAFNSKRRDQRVKEVEVITKSMSIIPISEFLREFGIQKALLVSKGELIGDLDIYIAITALNRNLILVTGNERHHSRIEGIKIQNWRKSEFNNYL